jgi:IS5 family transposase
MKQQTLSVAADENAGFEQYRRPTKRDMFLATEKIVPWAELCSVIEPHHPLPDLLHGQGQRVYSDCAYVSQVELIHSKAQQAVDMTNKTVRPGSPTDELERMVNRRKSRGRSRVEQVYGVVKELWGFTKVRCRGLTKNSTRAFVIMALANLFLARKRLLA